MKKNMAKIHWIPNSIEIPLVGRVQLCAFRGSFIWVLVIFEWETDSHNLVYKFVILSM